MYSFTSCPCVGFVLTFQFSFMCAACARQLARDHFMCAECVATFPRSPGRPPLVPVHVAGELWPNALNRAVGVLGSSGMGWGAMVLPFLSRRSEGAALHATSVECFNTTTVQYDQWPVDEVRASGRRCPFDCIYYVLVV
jgi:hypothetical protein